MPKKQSNNDPQALIKEKECSKCNESKKLIDFPYHNKSKNTYRPDCRECRNMALKLEHLKRKIIKAGIIINK